MAAPTDPLSVILSIKTRFTVHATPSFKINPPGLFHAAHLVAQILQTVWLKQKSTTLESDFKKE